MSQETKPARAKKVPKTPDELIQIGLESIKKGVEAKVDSQSKSAFAKTIANELKKAEKKVQDGKSKSDKKTVQDVITKNLMITDKVTMSDQIAILSEVFQYFLKEPPTQ